MSRLILQDIPLDNNYINFILEYDNIHKIFQYIDKEVQLKEHINHKSLRYKKRYIKINVNYDFDNLLYFATNKNDLSRIDFITDEKIIKSINKTNFDKIDESDWKNITELNYHKNMYYYKLNKKYGVIPFFTDYHIKLYFDSDFDTTNDKIYLYDKRLHFEKFAISNLFSSQDYDCIKLLDLRPPNWIWKFAEDDVSDNEDNI